MATTAARVLFSASGPATVLSVGAGAVSSVARGPIAVLDVPEGGDGTPPLRLVAVADWSYPLTQQPVLQVQERSFVLPASATLHFVLNVGPLSPDQLQRLVALLHSSTTVRGSVGPGGSGGELVAGPPDAVARRVVSGGDSAGTSSGSLGELVYAGGSALASATVAVAAGVGSAVVSLLSPAPAPIAATGAAPIAATGAAPALASLPPPHTAAAAQAARPSPSAAAAPVPDGGDAAAAGAGAVATAGAVVSTGIVLGGKAVVAAAVVAADLAGRGVRWCVGLVRPPLPATAPHMRRHLLRRPQ